MAVDFDKFDKEVDLDGLQKDIEESKKNGGFEDLPKGTYIVSIEKMELGETKADGRPMFKMQCKVKQGAYKGRNIFMNRVIYGTKNDGAAIQSVITFLEKLEPQNTVVGFKNYSSFSDIILDIYEELQNAVEVEIDYDAKAFNTISIKEVFDI